MTTSQKLSVRKSMISNFSNNKNSFVTGSSMAFVTGSSMALVTGSSM